MTNEKYTVTDTDAMDVNGGSISAPAQIPDFPVDPITIDSEKCVGCGTCAALCPVNAIRIPDGTAVLRGHCIECGTCESACPVNAIRRTA